MLLKKLPLVVLTLFCSISTLTYAEQTLFKCTTTNGKVAKVSYANRNFTYTFGYPNKPELKLKNHDTVIDAYSGKGGAGIIFQNGSYSYDINTTFTNSGNQGIIDVSKGNKTLATVHCKGQPYFNEELYYESLGCLVVDGC